ncbi:hypothetical protein J6590_002574 [Homalodisca vitripennis]|nr:hypothetical protein J6590_002574 [Homalodisca vitripennis]
MVAYTNWILQLQSGRVGEGVNTARADVALLDQSPEHVCAMMTVGRPVKCFLAETVPVAGWGIGRDRRHDPRPTAAPFTPDFHREITLCTIILHVYVISEPYTNIVVPERIPEIQSYMPKAHFGMPSLHS